MVPITFALSKEKSLANAAICQLSNNDIEVRTAKNNSKQKVTANPLGIFFDSSFLQKGKKNVAHTPPIQSGIKKSFSKI